MRRFAPLTNTQSIPAGDWQQDKPQRRSAFLSSTLGAPARANGELVVGVVPIVRATFLSSWPLDARWRCPSFRGKVGSDEKRGKGEGNECGYTVDEPQATKRDTLSPLAAS